MKRGYLLLFLLGNLSCVSNPHSMVAEGGIPRLHVDGTEVKETIPFDSLFKKDKIISLETTAESLIKKVGKISLYKNSIYLLDRSQNKLLQFDMEGHFIRSINHFGQGSGHYLQHKPGPGCGQDAHQADCL